MSPWVELHGYRYQVLTVGSELFDPAAIGPPTGAGHNAICTTAQREGPGRHIHTNTHFGSYQRLLPTASRLNPFNPSPLAGDVAEWPAETVAPCGALCSSRSMPSSPYYRPWPRSASGGPRNLNHGRESYQEVAASLTWPSCSQSLGAPSAWAKLLRS